MYENEYKWHIASLCLEVQNLKNELRQEKQRSESITSATAEMELTRIKSERDIALDSLSTARALLREVRAEWVDEQYQYSDDCLVSRIDAVLKEGE